MKVENNIAFAEIVEAVKLWACKVDGYDGAVGGIYEQIPWDGNMESIIPWDDVEDRFSAVIPSCDNVGIDVGKIVLDNKEEKMKLANVAEAIAIDIIRVYNVIITEINDKLNRKSVSVKKFIGVVNGVCEYSEPVVSFLSDTWIGVFRQVVNYYKFKDYFEWYDDGKFIDACYAALHANGSVFLGGGFHLIFPIDKAD